jgi:hypothetical protein
MTSSVTGGAISSSLSALEPMVYFSTYQVYANVECGSSEDYNRMSAKSSLSQADSNKGWGLGTLYDATHGSTTICGPSGSASARPQCDAQVRGVLLCALLCAPPLLCAAAAAAAGSAGGGATAVFFFLFVLLFLLWLQFVSCCCGGGGCRAVQAAGALCSPGDAEWRSASV